MLKRILVAAVGLPLLVLLLAVAPDWAAAALIAAMCAIGAWELMSAVNARGRAVTALEAAIIPLWLYFPGGESLGAFLLLALLLLFLATILRYERGTPLSFASLTASVFSGVVFPLLLSCLLRLRLLPGGRALVFAPLCICFGSDTLALFTGALLGRHKLAPKASPKKTMEGAVGGLLGGVAGLAALKGILVLLESEAALSWRSVAVLGVLGGAIGELGDLSFSVIKREFGVKDYGNILPGHGGVLDRFDSVTFVAPAVWYLWILSGGWQ